jgi:hypothetical protein
VRASLLRAYRETTYETTCYETTGYGTARYETAGYETGDIVVRIGRRVPAMDKLLSSAGAKQAVFITAYNPFSRVMPPGWNNRMQARLAEALRRYPLLPARGHYRDWSERHLLALADVRVMRRLARRFRQNAIVIVRWRQPVRLLVTSSLM